MSLVTTESINMSSNVNDTSHQSNGIRTSGGQFSFEMLMLNVAFFAFIVTSAVFHRLDNQERENFWNKLKKYYHMLEKSGVPHGTAAYIVFRILYNLGILLVIEISCFICLFLYILRKQNYMRNSQRRDANEALKDPEQLRRFLGGDMPSWVTFPDNDRVTWIDQIVTNLWPEIAFSTEKTIENIMREKLEENRPSFLTKLELSRCHIGPVPIKFNGAKTSCSAKETVIDLPISWHGKTDIRLAFGCSPVLEVEAVIVNLQFTATLRIVLGPHVKKWPCFAAVSISFLSKPLIDFELQVARLTLDIIPGLGPWLDSFIKDKVADIMVHPHRLTFPTVPEYIVADHSVKADAIGTLSITIVRCNHLPSSFMNTPTAYVKIGNAKEDEVNYFRTTKICDSNPVFGETFRFTIYNRHMQIKLLVCKKSDLIKKTYSKIIKNSKIIGYKTLYVNTLLDGEFETTEKLSGYDFAGADDKIPTVTYKTKYTVFKSVDLNKQTDHTSPRPPHNLPSRQRAPSVKEPSIPINRPPPSPSNSALTPNYLHQNGSFKESGTLFIIVDRCNNIKNTEDIGKADLYVILTVNGRSVKTNVIKSCLDPVFMASFELRVDDTLRDTLEVLVNDYERIGSHKRAGETSIMISDVKKNNGIWKNSWSLIPQGTITMELKLLVNER